MTVGDISSASTGATARPVAGSREGHAASLAPFAALVVEDNILIAMDAEEVLRELGASEVQLCASVGRALDSIAGSTFAVALLDVSLGDETSEAVAIALQDRGTPFIVTTGFGDHVSDIAAYAGAPVLTKPYSAAVLSQALEQVMTA